MQGSRHPIPTLTASTQAFLPVYPLISTTQAQSPSFLTEALVCGVCLNFVLDLGSQVSAICAFVVCSTPRTRKAGQSFPKQLPLSSGAVSFLTFLLPPLAQNSPVSHPMVLRQLDSMVISSFLLPTALPHSQPIDVSPAPASVSTSTKGKGVSSCQRRLGIAATIQSLYLAPACVFLSLNIIYTPVTPQLLLQTRLLSLLPTQGVNPTLLGLPSTPEPAHRPPPFASLFLPGSGARKPGRCPWRSFSLVPTSFCK